MESTNITTNEQETPTREVRYLAYELVDPETNVPRYVGITIRSLRERFVGHISDVNNRPDLNPHKTAWFLKLRKKGLIPTIRLAKECNNLEELKQFEIDYISKYKEVYKLINQTTGGEHLGFRSHSRESILKKATTKAIVQYNVLGEKIAEYEMIEDAVRSLGINNDKAGSHISSVCKGKRRLAYNYIWRYKGEELGNISDISPLSLQCCKLIQYSQDNEKIAEYTSYREAARALGLASDANIASCIAGKQNTCKGFIFQAEPLYAYFDQSLFETRIKEYYMTNKRNNYKKKKSTTLTIGAYVNNELVKTFNSYSEASEFVIGTINGRKSIKECCEGTRDSYHNYTFKIIHE